MLIKMNIKYCILVLLESAGRVFFFFQISLVLGILRDLVFRKVNLFFKMLFFIYYHWLLAERLEGYIINIERLLSEERSFNKHVPLLFCGR